LAPGGDLGASSGPYVAKLGHPYIYHNTNKDPDICCCSILPGAATARCSLRALARVSTRRILLVDSKISSLRNREKSAYGLSILSPLGSWSCGGRGQEYGIKSSIRPSRSSQASSSAITSLSLRFGAITNWQ